jgi:peptidoglycan-associated lipoprotein
MIRSKLPLSATLLALCAVGSTACHHAPPAAVAPAPVTHAAVNNNDADAAARAAAARRDSIARADAARRDAAARAEADRLAREAAAAKSALSAKVYFDYQRDELRNESKAALDAKIPVLRAHPGLKIRIEGNADDRGSAEYNIALGQRRSAAAKRYIVSQGIDASRIDIVSFGKERPVCEVDAETCWHQNRRDDFVIVAGTDAFTPHGPME